MDTIDADDGASAAQFYDKVPKQFLYTKEQAAAALAMSTGHPDELVRGRKIRAVKDGGRQIRPKIFPPPKKLMPTPWAVEAFLT